MCRIDVRVQTQDFNLDQEYQSLRVDHQIGAIVCFSGLVREFNQDQSASFYLQHYPGMTEKVLRELAQQASQQWPLNAVTIVHRVGQLLAGDQIVLVAVASAHRQASFAAAQYLMDLLKTQAPFWKKEGERWVEAKDSDQRAAEAWRDHNKAD